MKIVVVSVIEFELLAYQAPADSTQAVNAQSKARAVVTLRAPTPDQSQFWTWFIPNPLPPART